MIQATEPYRNHQHYGQREPRSELRGIGAGTERHAESADPFHDNDVRPLGERVEATSDVVQINLHSSFGGRDVRCDRRREAVGIDVLAWGSNIPGRDQPLDVVMHEAAPARDGTARDRLHADCS
jgi:hypothetical protein